MSAEPTSQPTPMSQPTPPAHPTHPGWATGRVGMVGAGQLARMTQRAAIDLGVHLDVLALRADEPAPLAGSGWVLGAPADEAAMAALAARVEVVTLDHELVPTERLEALQAAGHRVHPSPSALRFAQDKLHARRELGALGFPVPAFAPVRDLDDVTAFAAEHGWPVVLKARAGGYDGRGVAVVEDAEAAAAVLGVADGGGAAADGAAPDTPAGAAPDTPAGAAPAGVASDALAGAASEPDWLVEAAVPIATEVAVVTARRPGGEHVTYPVVETVQSDGICVELVMPARVSAPVAAAALDLADRIAAAIGAVGILAVELFITVDGEVVVNEVALRPHNSGHATIEGSTTSQFTNHLRAVLDWPLGDTAMRAPVAVTVNLLGGDEPTDLAARLPWALALPDVHVHLYGKDSRPARKLGHVTVLGADVEVARRTAWEAADRLVGPVGPPTA